MPRRRWFALVALALGLSACGGSSPTPADPRVLVRQGVEATLAAGTFHVSATLDGSITAAGMTSPLSLNGTTLEADVDAAAMRTHATFGVPGLLGLSGELIVIGSDAYVTSSITGPGWFHAPLAQGDAVTTLTNPATVLSTITDLLDATGVELATRETTDCDGTPCTHVELTIPADQLGGVTAAAGGLLPADLLADGLVVDLYVDTSEGRLVELDTEIDSASAQALRLSVTIGSFGGSLSIEPPPASDIQEGGGLPF